MTPEDIDRILHRIDRNLDRIARWTAVILLSLAMAVIVRSLWANLA